MLPLRAEIHLTWLLPAKRNASEGSGGVESRKNRKKQSKDGGKKSRPKCNETQDPAHSLFHSLLYENIHIYICMRELRLWHVFVLIKVLQQNLMKCWQASATVSVSVSHPATRTSISGLACFPDRPKTWTCSDCDCCKVMCVQMGEQGQVLPGPQRMLLIFTLEEFGRMPFN